MASYHEVRDKLTNTQLKIRQKQKIYEKRTKKLLNKKNCHMNHF